MRHATRRSAHGIVAATFAMTLASAFAPVPALGQEATAKAAPAASILEGAERMGAGRVTAWRKGASILVVLRAGDLGKPVLWYTEVVGIPAGVVAKDGLAVVSALTRFERVGSVVHVRDLSTTQKRRGGTPPEERQPGNVAGAEPRDPKLRPIDVALGSMETGALMASFPVRETLPDGDLVLDVTATFSTDVPAATGRHFVALSGVVPAAVDPSKSYIDAVRVRGESLNIRTHLTFMAAVPAVPLIGPQPASIVMGHSLVFLPEKPMASRQADPRVGYYTTKFVQFEADRGTAQEEKSLIARFRLEKVDPKAAVSDPVKPITYYLGPGVPERWKPYLRAGVLQWLPVFEAAGFSNAIRVLDAPSPQQDPNWSVEDVTINVIRWLPEERANAMGPHVVDPRSGETLSAHIQIWPTVIDFFGQYYWSLFGTVDPEASRLPLSTEKSGALLSYVVAHEVGHTLGLMHNQIASTAHSVKQLRDPAFANKYGPNSSIMAYGRFNQAAQPGDGVKQFWGVAGPYDYAAIRYGYGAFGGDPAAENRALAEFAETFATDRRLYWASEESGELINRFGHDPRVQTENVGAERVEATRLGVANILRSLGRLDAATQGDAPLYASTYAMLMGRQSALLQSVNRMIGGTMPALGKGEGPPAKLVPAAEQRQAVNYLLGEGVASLEPYKNPAIVERVSAYGGYLAVDRLQGSFIAGIMNGPNVALLESQKRRDPAAYSSIDLGRDVTAAVWGDLKTANAMRRALQHGYVEAARKLLEGWTKAGADEAALAKKVQAEAPGMSGAVARLLVESGDETIFIPWLRSTLPDLKTKLEAASRTATDETDRLHFGGMAVQMARLLKIGAP